MNPNAEPGFSLAGGATVDPAGNLYIGWTAYARRDVNNRPVSIYFSRSADGGRAWTTALLDQSERSSRMRTGKVPDGIPGTSDRACLRCCRRTLRFVECRCGERRSGAHLLFILNHGGSNLVGAGGRFRSQRQCRACISSYHCRTFRRCSSGLDGYEKDGVVAATAYAVEHILPQFHEWRSYLGSGTATVQRGARLRLHSRRRIPLPFWRLLRAHH